MKPFLEVVREGPVVIATMNRPDTRNALAEQASCDEFVSLCAALNQDMSVGALILTGAGKAFSAGGDLKMMKARNGIGPGKTPFATRQNYVRGIQTIPLALYELEVPTIAAVNGPAMGAGLDLALMCDIRIASERASFAESFVKLGIVPGDGGAWLLQRVVGTSKAFEMSFTGEALDAAQALACGLISEVTTEADLTDAARRLAKRITVNPIPSVRLTKRLIRESQHTRLDTALQLSAAFQAISHETVDHGEALDAWLEKRPPVFTNQ